MDASDANSLRLRRAELEDSRFFWKTNNHPSVRANSIDTSSIPWEQHRKWYEASFESDTRMLWIAEFDSDRCGVVRMDLSGDADSAEISVALNPDYRGRGLGRECIRMSSERVLEQTEATRVDALVRPENEASIRAFEAAGYEPRETTKRDGVALRRFVFR